MDVLYDYQTPQGGGVEQVQLATQSLPRTPGVEENILDHVIQYLKSFHELHLSSGKNCSITVDDILQALANKDQPAIILGEGAFNEALEINLQAQKLVLKVPKYDPTSPVALASAQHMLSLAQDNLIKNPSPYLPKHIATLTAGDDTEPITVAIIHEKAEGVSILEALRKRQVTPYDGKELLREILEYFTTQGMTLWDTDLSNFLLCTSGTKPRLILIDPSSLIQTSLAPWSVDEIKNLLFKKCDDVLGPRSR